MKIKEFFRKLVDPASVKEEKMNEFWNSHPKTVRITCEFENGVVKELTGDDAETYAKTLYWINNGFYHYKERLKTLDWKPVIKN